MSCVRIGGKLKCVVPRSNLTEGKVYTAMSLCLGDTLDHRTGECTVQIKNDAGELVGLRVNRFVKVNGIDRNLPKWF